MTVQSDDLKLLFNYVAERNTSEVDKQLFLSAEITLRKTVHSL